MISIPWQVKDPYEAVRRPFVASVENGSAEFHRAHAGNVLAFVSLVPFRVGLSGEFVHFDLARGLDKLYETRFISIST